MVRAELQSTYLTESLPPVWHYPRKYTGALILGNLLAAILMRNELFGRLLYLIVNTCFAKVCKRTPIHYFACPYTVGTLTTLFDD